VLERGWNETPGSSLNTNGQQAQGASPQGAAQGASVSPGALTPKLPAQALAWVQSFIYERDQTGSDFVNPVSAILEGRGDCDSRALVWAIILEQANIPAAMMVSQEYSHAMGLVDIAGPGARFEIENKKWLVAETTAPVSLGLIGQDVSGIEHWIGGLLD
jgi:hypothetical protein